MIQLKRPTRIAIFHDNFAQWGGAERVAEALQRTFPGSDLHTTLVVRKRLSNYLRSIPVIATWMQYLPAKARYFRYYFLLYPFAVESVDLDTYDLVITSCFGYAKGVKRGSSPAVHICYCHTPMRWVWRTEDYLSREGMPAWKELLLRWLLKPLKAWELRAARRPDYYIANSAVVADRLHRAFGVESVVIPPPIETSRFHISDQVGDYFLVISRLVPYKRIDLAVLACTQLNLSLIIVGDGPDRARLEALAGPTITFAGRASDAEVNDYASRCRALIFPGEEDFGMTPLEVNAAGRPVIAYKGGGAAETITEGLNGIFFDDPSVESLQNAITRFQHFTWDSQRIRERAMEFDIATFQQRILEFVASKLPHGSIPKA